MTTTIINRDGLTNYKACVFNLFKGRHEMPFEDAPAIFSGETSPMDFSGLEYEAMNSMNPALNMPTWRAVVYVTGLTMATVAVINVCRRMGIELVLMHYDRDTGAYKPQFVEE